MPIKIGHIGLYRDEKSLEPVSYYAKFPTDILDGVVLVVDPMLATGDQLQQQSLNLKIVVLKMLDLLV